MLGRIFYYTFFFYLSGNSTYYTLRTSLMIIHWLVGNSETAAVKEDDISSLWKLICLFNLSSCCGSGGFSVSVLKRNVIVPSYSIRREDCKKSLIGNRGSGSCGFYVTLILRLADVVGGLRHWITEEMWMKFFIPTTFGLTVKTMTDRINLTLRWNIWSLMMTLRLNIRHVTFPHAFSSHKRSISIYLFILI